MRKSLLLLTALLWAGLCLAQTPKEIILRMEEQLNKQEADGVGFAIEMKVPLVGSFSMASKSKGDKMRSEMEVKGKKIIVWTDGTTSWTYNSADNKVTIEPAGSAESPHEESADMHMFDDILQGYDVTLDKETADAWHIRCKKQRGNPDKDAPKSMDLVVGKGNYYPRSMSFKVSGVTMTMRNFDFDVREEELVFDKAAFPNAQIEDKR